MVRAIILAAGRGLRLRPAVDSIPKSLVEIGSTTLIERMIALLRDARIAPITIVTGHLAPALEALVAGTPVRTAHNPDFAKTGTMQSLAVGLAAGSPGRSAPTTDDRVMLLNGDIVMERRTIGALLATPPQSSVTVVTDVADRGDEVYAGIRDGLLTSISKDRSAISGTVSEMVGISLLTSSTLAAMEHAWQNEARLGSEANYEAVMIRVAAHEAIAALHLGALAWGEVDDAEQLAEMRARVFPEIVRRDERE